MNDVLQTLQKNLPVLKSKYPLKTLGVFGSYSRGEETIDSDLDIIYETLPDTYLNLHSFLNLQQELAQLTKLKIDLVNKKYINEAVWLTAQKDVLYV